jgi:hypothetical protein
MSASRIRAVDSDYRTARECRRRADECRQSWDAGRAREIDHVIQRAFAGDRRFIGKSERDLQMIGAVRWSQSTEAHRLRRREERYAQRAVLNLACARFGTHIRALAESHRGFQ